MCGMKKGLTEIVFILDRSGSMAGLEKDTIGGFNAFVEKQMEQKGEVRVTAVLFDNYYELLWNAVRAEEAKLTEKEYFVRGSTALYDAVGKTILDISSRIDYTTESERPEKVIFVIITDGLENSSREFTHNKIKQLIHHYQHKHNWDFLFFGANIDAAAEADHIGISHCSAFNFEADCDGVRTMYEKVSETVSEKRNEEL